MNGVEILGAERIVYYWILGICFVLFCSLVVIWRIRLKKSAKKNPAHLVARMQR